MSRCSLVRVLIFSLCHTIFKLEFLYLLVLSLQLYSLLFSAASAKLLTDVGLAQVIQAFSSGIRAVMQYGRGQQGDRTMVCVQYFVGDKPI